MANTRMRTVYCIALEGNATTGVDWYFNADDRRRNKGKSGAETEIPFTISVPYGISHDEITETVDSAAWCTEYTPDPNW